MKWSLSLLITFLGISAFGSPGQVAFKGGTWNFQTENVTNRNQSSSGAGAYSVELGYRFSNQWMLSFGMNLVMSDIVQGSSGYGFDIGTKYFPLTASGTDQSSSETVELVVREVWRPYFGLFFRQRIFGLAISTSYIGPGASLGLDYSLNSKWLINGEIRYDYLYGSGDALAKQTNLMIGLGFEF